MSDDALIGSYRGSRGESFHVESICLVEDEYTFTISDYGLDGMCCKRGKGYYNVTTPEGVVIAEGAEFQIAEATEFQIPFIEGSSTTTQENYPTLMPTFSTPA